MGVKGLDLGEPGKSCMPRTHGWPRYQSVQKINANTQVLNRLASAPMVPIMMPLMTPGVFAFAN